MQAPDWMFAMFVPSIIIISSFLKLFLPFFSLLNCRRTSIPHFNTGEYERSHTRLRSESSRSLRRPFRPTLHSHLDKEDQYRGSRTIPRRGFPCPSSSGILGSQVDTVGSKDNHSPRSLLVVVCRLCLYPPPPRLPNRAHPRSAALHQCRCSVHSPSIQIADIVGLSAEAAQYASR